ncbi:DNA polymerase theta-like isoform X2 [Aricia agestis]|uniref:DNA polymerase theta-like isoform X2 n=1 Tax=Aricia agestis TaxID=91739 RepID=UPI001C20A2FA|nr:DNA polymerase theta-like isoform X2 [Aricia agestis]
MKNLYQKLHKNFSVQEDFCKDFNNQQQHLLDRLHFGIHSDLLELMKLSTLNGARARTLFDAGFETIASIASASANDIENTLHKAAPFQSDKELENDDDADVRKRKKMKNIWITGCCGMTAREAAERLILEARKYLQLEIGVTDINWENKESRSCIEIENQSNIRESSLLQQTDYDKESQNNNKDKLQFIDIKTVTEHCTIKNENKCNELEHIIPESKTMPLNELGSSHELEILTSQNYFNHIESTVRNQSNNSIRKYGNGNAYSNKDDVVWDSLFLSDTVLRNITTGRSTLAVPSPNISFDESELISSANSAKDISLFSSDDNNSSIFEDTINIDTMCDNANQSKEDILNMLDQDIANETINSNTILNAFKSTIIDIDEDEDIKLVYEDENKISEVNIASIGTISSNEKSISNRRINEISSLKRNANTDRIFESPNKKIRQQNISKANYNVMMKCSQSKKNILRVAGSEIKCYVLKEEDIINNLSMIEKHKEVAVILDVDFKQKSQSNVIGQMICNKNKCALNRNDPYPSNEVVKGLSFYLSKDECYYCDVSSIVKSLPAVKLRLKRMFNDKTYTVKLASTKSYAAHIKRWMNIELSCRCSDISVVDWLLDSGENLYNVIELTKKFCDIDVPKVDIIVNDKTCKYDNLDEITRSCLKAWCVFSVNEKQKKFIEKYDFLERISDIETHIAKILGKCEYYGIAVDKQLASQLLVDVKNSQEILQKKAFKLCGYHFNFNSSKDVAKVLGIYNGRKISTKKSVLTAHNSPMASIVIYWRKLNSILTKTLYPLTEQASIYSSDNRISPTYATYTTTGRISMHEPNLQNVPRTFAVPIKYLTLNEIEPCDDVIEFNCRNIFKAAPGCTFVSADYCQLEMRILTHYSEDVVLTKIMGSNVDVFRSIAASWSGVPEDQVDDDLRQKAKQLCYGILYGMGNRTLAQQLDVSEMEAAVFMDAFYTTYPAIRTFTGRVVDDCRRHGYVETLMKRRRYLPDINSAVAAKRSAAERQAVNTTIQGSAADIAKAAMCAIDSRTSGPGQPRLVLQMHDELIYEVPETKKYTFPLILKEVMENTVQLSVPLPVKVRTGSSWGCLEEMKF